MKCMLRKLIWILPAVFCLFLMVTPQTTQAASYDDFTLASYGIPDDIIQALMDDSTYADGTTATASSGKTAATFTVGDVAQLTTVSLAKHPKSGSSVVDSRVASWVASFAVTDSTKPNVGYATDGTVAYDVNANVYTANYDSGSVNSLANQGLVFDGHTAAEKYRPTFNMLMLIIASADKATTVDLTGMLSGVSDSSLAQQLICLLQTARLTHLNTLVLGNNNLTTLGLYLFGTTVFAVTSEQNVTTLDLSNNNVTTVAWGNAFSIMDKLTVLNLAGNVTTTITGTLDDMMTHIVNNAGTTDLSDSDLNTADWNTLNYVITIINADTGVLALSDKSINAIVTAAPDQLKAATIEKYLSQLTSDSAQLLLDKNPNIVVGSALYEKLKQRAEGKTDNGGSDTFAIDTNLSFGNQKLATTITSDQSLTVNATFLAHSSLQVQMSTWQSANGDEFTGVLKFGHTPWGAIEIDGTESVVVYTNMTGGTITVPSEDSSDNTLSDISLALTNRGIASIKTGIEYTSTMTWTISTTPSSVAR